MLVGEPDNAGILRIFHTYTHKINVATLHLATDNIWWRIIVWDTKSFIKWLDQNFFCGSTFWISIRTGFRSPPSRRMAAWLWIRCVLGPHLQRIHRPPEQPLTESRTGRRVGLFSIFCLLPSTAICEHLSLFNLSVLMWFRPGTGSFRCIIDNLLHSSSRLAVNEWKRCAAIIRVCPLMAQLFSSHSSTNKAAWHVFSLTLWHLTGHANAKWN